MIVPDPPSLTPEERGFAQRLARVGPHGSPSPAIDARILAAAHAAATAPTRVRRRWPVALGMMASLVLAVGIAWRLRPLPETTPMYRPEAATVVGVQAPSATSPPPVETPADDSLQAPADAGDLAGAANRPQPPERASERRDQPEGPAVAARSAAEPAANLDQPAAPTAPIPAAAKAADVPVPNDTPQAFATPAAANPPVRDAVAGTQQRRATAPETSSTDVTQEANTAQVARGDEPPDDIPPATADSPAVRDAWLQRIHDLVDSGDIAGARASLREFTRRYPAYPLPPELTALQR